MPPLQTSSPSFAGPMYFVFFLSLSPSFLWRDLSGIKQTGIESGLGRGCSTSVFSIARKKNMVRPRPHAAVYTIATRGKQITKLAVTCGFETTEGARCESENHRKDGHSLETTAKYEHKLQAGTRTKERDGGEDVRTCEQVISERAQMRLCVRRRNESQKATPRAQERYLLSRFQMTGRSLRREKKLEGKLSSFGTRDRKSVV